MLTVVGSEAVAAATAEATAADVANAKSSSPPEGAAGKQNCQPLLFSVHAYDARLSASWQFAKKRRTFGPGRLLGSKTNS